MPLKCYSRNLQFCHRVGALYHGENAFVAWKCCSRSLQFGHTMPLKCSSRNVQCPHVMLFTKEKGPWCHWNAPVEMYYFLLILGDHYHGENGFGALLCPFTNEACLVMYVEPYRCMDGPCFIQGFINYYEVIRKVFLFTSQLPLIIIIKRWADGFISIL